MSKFRHPGFSRTSLACARARCFILSAHETNFTLSGIAHDTGGAALARAIGHRRAGGTDQAVERLCAGFAGGQGQSKAADRSAGQGGSVLAGTTAGPAQRQFCQPGGFAVARQAGAGNRGQTPERPGGHSQGTGEPGQSRGQTHQTQPLRERRSLRRALPDKAIEHTIASGDTLSSIVSAYNKEKGLKLTTDLILKANPGLDPLRLKVGQKIMVPLVEK